MKNNKDLLEQKNKNTLLRIFLSSFLTISLFYIIPIFINFADKNFYTKEYKNNSKKKPIQERPYKPHRDDVMEWCSLEEVADFLKDDPELTDQERFELYYDERERRLPKEKGLSYNQLLKKSGIKPPKIDIPDFVK